MNTVMEIKVKAWAPTAICKSPDNIVSSPFTTQKVFVPSYEKEKRPCIEQLLTNEYQRIWWQEKESWDKRYQSKTATKKLLQRMIIKRKPVTAPVIVAKPKKIKQPKKKEVKKEELKELKSTKKEEIKEKKQEKKEGKKEEKKEGKKEEKKEGKKEENKAAEHEKTNVEKTKDVEVETS
ncbi:hypothetical protein ANTRET_LOCUS5496 [Anthophora retusa]